MLTLTTLEGRMIGIYHEAITGIEETSNHTMIWVGNQLHRVKEDVETVFDMWAGLQNQDTDSDENAGMIHPQVLLNHLEESGHPAPLETVHELVQRSAATGSDNVDNNGRPVITPAVEPWVICPICGSGEKPHTHTLEEVNNVLGKPND